MLGAILRKEIQLALRAGRMQPLFTVWLLLAVLAALGSVAAQQRAQVERSAAAQVERRAWEAQGARNPHAAAHFGQYVYKPATALAALEPGLDAWLGASVWMEAHYQNPPTQRAAEDLTPLSRMGALSLGWLMQVLLPLTILVLGFDLLAEERARGVLKLQLAMGASITKLMFGKGLALLAGSLLVTLPAWVAGATICALIDAEALNDGALRFALWTATYAIYGLVWLLLTIAVSGLASSARLSLALLCGLWLLGTLLLPRLAAEQAEAAYPAPEASAFWADIRQALSEGIDGHNADNAYARRLEADTLRRYGVTRIEDLPVSYAGIALQASEDYGERVFDRYYGALWSTYRMQAQTQALWAWGAPMLAARELATQAAGTDLIHHGRFSEAAEMQRRELQRFLNEDMTAHAKGEDYDYLAPAALWAQAPRFSYTPPAVQVSGRAGAVLGLWLAGALLACVAAARRQDREV